MNSPEYKDLTDEQKKEIDKVWSKARRASYFVITKFSVGLLSANLISMFLGLILLKDVDPEYRIIFQTLLFPINFVFMTAYLYTQFKENSQKTIAAIKEILKK